MIWRLAALEMKTLSRLKLRHGQGSKWNKCLTLNESSGPMEPRNHIDSEIW